MGQQQYRHLECRGNFGTGNLLGLVTTGTFTASGFAGPGTTVGSMNQSGYTFGGFFGAQKQRGNWVLGIEADYRHDRYQGLDKQQRHQSR